MTGRAALLAALVLAMAITPLILAEILVRYRRRKAPPRVRRECPPLNPHVPMPDGPDPLAAPWGRCGCELVWRPCVIHDPAWPAEMERMVRGDSEPA